MCKLKIETEQSTTFFATKTKRQAQTQKPGAERKSRAPNSTCPSRAPSAGFRSASHLSGATLQLGLPKVLYYPEIMEKIEIIINFVLRKQ